MIRRKTTLCLAQPLADEVHEMSEELGVSKSCLHSLAVAFFVAHASRLITPAKREKSLEAVAEEFKRLMADARNSLETCPDA